MTTTSRPVRGWVGGQGPAEPPHPRPDRAALRRWLPGPVPADGPGRGVDRAGGERDWCFSRRARRTGLLFGPIGIVAATAAGAWAHGPSGYPAAWAVAGALFMVPGTVLAAMVRRRANGFDRVFWTFWLGGQLAGSGFGACLVLRLVDPVVLERVGAGLLGLAAALWGIGLVAAVSRTDGARVLAIDALEITVADLAVAAPVLVVVAPAVAHARDTWYAFPGTVAAAGLPLVAALSMTLCVRLPARERSPELIGTLAAVVGEGNAVLQAVQGIDGFHLPTAPLLAVQGVSMWLLLALVLHAHRQFPEGLDRLSPDAQVRRWSPLPLLVVASVSVLAVEAVTAPADRPWEVPAVVAVLGLLAILMTARHLLVVRETGRLYRQLAAEARERHRLLDDLVQAVEDDRHRVVVQLHELASEWMAAVGAVLRTSRSPAGDEASTVVTGALGRMYADIGTRAESLRRLAQAVRPPAFNGESLRSAVAASTVSIFGAGRAPKIDVQMAEGIELDWTTSTIVYRLVLESLRGALRRGPVQHVTVTVDSGGPGGALRVLVVDDAAGRDPLAGDDEPRLSTLQLFADLGHGEVEVTRRAGGGTEVCATLGSRR